MIEMPERADDPAAPADFMTPEDADQLERWVKVMTPEQCKLLWKWVAMAWAEKMSRLGPPPLPKSSYTRKQQG